MSNLISPSLISAFILYPETPAESIGTILKFHIPKNLQALYLKPKTYAVSLISPVIPAAPPDTCQKHQSRNGWDIPKPAGRDASQLFMGQVQRHGKTKDPQRIHYGPAPGQFRHTKIQKHPEHHLVTHIRQEIQRHPRCHSSCRTAAFGR